MRAKFVATQRGSLTSAYKGHCKRVTKVKVFVCAWVLRGNSTDVFSLCRRKGGKVKNKEGFLKKLMSSDLSSHGVPVVVVKTPGPGAQYASAVGLDPVVPRQLSDATTCTYDDILPYDSVTFDVRHFYFNVVGGCQRLSDEEWTRALPLLSMCATSGFAILPPTTVDEVVNDDEDDGDDDGAEEQVDTPESPLAPPHVPREPRSKDSPPVVEHATGTDAVGDEEEVEMEVESGAPLYNGLTKDKYISELVTHACADHLTKQEFSKRVDDLFACRCLFDYDSREHSELLAALDMAMSARYWRKRGIAPPSAGTDEESDREEEGDVVCDVEYVGGLGDY